MGSRLLISIALISFSALSAANDFGADSQAAFLSADQAFVADVWMDGEQATVAWQIAPGYYLYGHALAFELDGATLQASIPAGEPYRDEHFGDVSIYRDQLFVALPPEAARGTLTVHYQGCADAGLCYPPTQRSFTLPPP